MSDLLATTVVPLDGALANGEVGALLDAPAPEGDQVEDLALTADEWLDRRLGRAQQDGGDARAPGAHVDRAQGGEGRVCERCVHATHAAAREEVRA